MTGSAAVNGVSTTLLGTITVHAGTVPGQQTTFQVGPYDAASGNSFTNANFYDLDNSADPANPSGSSALYYSAAATSFSITTGVPEPGTAALASAVFAVACHRRRNAKR